ncbi:MAG: tetratricopeptide repeat protein [Planctomycetes bacterium]|nr:tetratricopeptide repeat protein [Planctomycetota bacterium]
MSSSRPGLLASIGLSVVLCCPSAAPEPPHAAPPPAAEPDRLYAGRFEADPRLRAILDAVPQARARAFQAVNERLALPYQDKGAILLRFRDSLDLSQRILVRGPGETFTTGADPTAGSARIVVTGMVEFLLADPGSLETELTHELTHAVLRERMGARYEGLPLWVREGLALWTAGQGPARVRYFLGRTEFLERPEGMLSNLADQNGRANYPEAFLAFDYLEALRGEAGVRQFVATLLSGKPWGGSLSEVSGQNWEAFQAGLRAHAPRAFARLADPGLPAYRALVALRTGLDTPEGAAAMLEAARRFAELQADSCHSRSARMWEGRALLRLERRAEARNCFERVAAAGGPFCDFEDDAIAEVGRLAVAEQDHEAALRTFQRIVDEHPDSRHLGEALYRCGLCLDRLGRRAEARPLLLKALASFPKAALAAEARAALGR